MRKKLLENQVAVITGASRGISRDIALCFAREGALLVLTSHESKNRLKEVQEQTQKLGSKSVSINGDISKFKFCETVFSETLKQFEKVDILVNCAGIITRAPMEKMTLNEWHRVIDVNLNGAYFMCRLVLPVMRQHKYGKIINVTSQMAHMPHPSASPSYEVSKAGLAALTRHLALHYAEFDVCVNAIAPGSINTEMPMSLSEKSREQIKNNIPMKRLGDAKEVGECALFLASEKSNYITGSTIHVNGGSLIL